MGIFSRLKKTVKNPLFLPTLIGAGPLPALMVTNPKETTEIAADAVKNTAKTAIQLPRAAVGGTAGLISDLTGNKTAKKVEMSAKKPINVPGIGEVKSLSAVPGDVQEFNAQTPRETAIQAGSMYLEAGLPGAGRAINAVGRTVKKVLPNMAKTAEALTNVSAEVYEKASNPKIAQTIKNVRQSGLGETSESLMSVGEEVFQKAQGARKAAMDTYKATREAIIGQNKGNIIQRSREFVSGVQEALKKNNIKIAEDGVEVVGSQFEGSASAKNFLDRAHRIMTRPLVQGNEAVDDLLTRREAISSIVDEIPVTEKNLRRVVKEMVSSFDTTLEKVLGSEATTLRSEYAKSIKPTNAVIDAMTVKRGSVREFSPDRASGFIKQAMSETKFDKKQLLTELDQITGTNFAETVEAMGLDKALSRLDPPMAGRVFDVIKTYGIAKIPLLSGFVSPKVWGELALRKGLKGAKAAQAITKSSNDFAKVLLKNIMTLPVRNVSTAGAALAADHEFENEFGATALKADTPPEKALSLTEDNLSDEELMSLFGAESVD